MESKIKHYMYVPFTGLGLYGGFRGNRWLKNRIKIFKQFVIPSLQAQTNKNFTVWISWRPEEARNKYVKELFEYFETTGLDYVFTFSGLCFYDDKLENDEAIKKLRENLELVPKSDADYVLMTIQPSDDCYHKEAVEAIQTILESDDYDACGFTKGYISDYISKDISEYNPTTNPPFYTIKFKKDDFENPDRHLEFTSLKYDVGKYKKGTPLPSHEYPKDVFIKIYQPSGIFENRYYEIDKRGFLVGTHSDNISTYYNHPFKGKQLDKGIFSNFGLDKVDNLKIRWSLRKKIMKFLPYKYQRKLRYWLGERLWNKIYDFLRS